MVTTKQKYETIRSKPLQEVRYEAVLDCGMKLLFAPRPGYSKKIAFVVADYGSIDNAWRRDDRRVTTPDGIAHFLEHMVFKKSHGDLTDVFAARGAYVNAHTSHTQTAYYFECTERFDDNLDTLLELALTPYFTKKLVDIERDIIVQEIRQYNDNASWSGFQQMMECLYVKHALRIDIAGTAETVARITPDLLNMCHGTFYHPSNLTLVVSGDFPREGLLALANSLAGKWAPKTPRPRVTRERPVEPARIQQHKRVKHMYVTRPRLMLGFKDARQPKGGKMTHRDVLTSIALDAMFSKESEAYEDLYGRRLIGGDFGATYDAEDDFGYAVIGGETPDAAALEAELLRIIERARKNGIDPKDIERKRRKQLGAFLRAFNDPEETAYAYMTAMSQRSELFDIPGMIENAGVSQVNRRIRELLTPDNYAVSIIAPATK
ncbi:MAG: insulinase family protein [Planctomycetes bacterium]|nr:insulinase family protein [Planctomycetota bacterium]